MKKEQIVYELELLKEIAKIACANENTKVVSDCCRKLLELTEELEEAYRQENNKE